MFLIKILQSKTLLKRYTNVNVLSS